MLSETEVCDRLSGLFDVDAGVCALRPHDGDDPVITISWTRNREMNSLVIQSTDGECPATGKSRSVSIHGSQLIMDTQIIPTEKSVPGEIDANLYILYSADHHTRYSEECNESMEYLEALLEILEAAE